LTLERAKISRLLESGDTRWIHRAAYDLMGYQPKASESPSAMPRGRSLYGPLPEQLKDTNSFVSRLSDILAIRRRYGIATSSQLEVPDVSDKAMLVMIHQLDAGQIQITVLNFSSRAITGHVSSTHLPPGDAVIDMSTDQVIAHVGGERTFPVTLEPHQGLSLLAVPDQHPALQFD
jgi:hypothetical protein